MLGRVVQSTGGVSLWRGLACSGQGLQGCLAEGLQGLTARHLATHANSDRPLSADPGVAEARRNNVAASSVSEPTLLHDSLSGADCAYRQRRPPPPRFSSISEPDYYLHNSLSEGTYQMPPVLQRSASLNPTRGQGFATAKQRPTMQRIVVVNRAAAQEPERLHNSFSHMDYDSTHKR